MTTSRPPLRAVIPARIGSTRFPKKILYPIQGKPMIQWVYDAVANSKLFDEVWLATDSKEAHDLIQNQKGLSSLTPSELPSGTDRAAWLAKDKGWNGWVTNIQGDEPLISETTLRPLVDHLKSLPPETSYVATLCIPTQDKDLNNPSTVKVVRDKEGFALYFSREGLKTQMNGSYLKHVGVYAYPASLLMQLQAMPPSPLELVERLEQLRALENRIPIKVLDTQGKLVAVDVPEDVTKVIQILEKTTKS